VSPICVPQFVQYICSPSLGEYGGKAAEVPGMRGRELFQLQHGITMIY
jgi:hypothetical protein